jgi:hypothetical protein
MITGTFYVRQSNPIIKLIKSLVFLNIIQLIFKITSNKLYKKIKQTFKIQNNQIKRLQIHKKYSYNSLIIYNI